MQTLAFDGRMGAAGDMVLGALLAAGADREALRPVEETLEVTYDVQTSDRNGIAATDVTVEFEDRRRPPESDESDRDPGRSGEDHDHARTYRDVIDLLDSMELPAGVREDAAAIFEVLGRAEAAVHDTDLASTTFHEVGADDAIADVVGATLLVADLDPDRIVTTPLAVGAGEVETAHGTYPVPAPAVVEVAERADWSIRGGPVEAELLTPTGAAILAHFAEGVDSLPGFRVESSGYGAGDHTFEDRANVLRAVVGEGGQLHREGVAVLETNLDDASPELLGGLQDTLPEVGALDVSILPLTMKKSRPGHLVKVLARQEDADRVARKLVEETGTLGVRQAVAGHRLRADRRVETVRIEAGGERFAVDVKVATDDAGAVLDVSAEYDDAAAVASETELPIREVMRRAETAWRDRE